MGIAGSFNASAYNTRRLARPFLPDVPHHPFLDPDFQDEDGPLVPNDLAPGGRLNWELPWPAKTNLHTMLELTEETEDLLDDFHSNLPDSGQVMEEWVEMRGASPTMTGEAKLRALAIQKRPLNVQNGGEEYRNSAESDYIFNMMRSVDSLGRSDVIYLADAFEQTKGNGQRSSTPENIEVVDWLEFDGPYVNTEQAFHEPKAEMRTSQSVPGIETLPSGRRTNSRPSILQMTDWFELDPVGYLSPNVYSPEPGSVLNQADKHFMPFKDFQRKHGNVNGAHTKLTGETPTRYAIENLPIRTC